MTGNQLRQKYLQFYQDRGHAIIPSASLVPDNDPTTLFTGSGMQPMLPYLLGETHPQGQRIADSQRCFRVQDIEEVGDNRHTTVFEMLGNWSLGNYFKAEQLPWMFEFLTKEVGLDPHHLYVSVFAGSDGIDKDQEAIALWQDLFAGVGIQAKAVDNADQNGMQGGRIFAYGPKKNWWSRSGTPDKMPVGEPGGPDSEIFYQFDQVEHTPDFGPHCHPNCDCGRYLEIGNNVFMQYQKQADGSFKPLPQKNIDFGGGLERMLAAAQNTPDVYKTDLFWPIIEAIQHSNPSGVTYQDNQYSHRVIADHLKAAVWLLSDGVIPSNKTQGYGLRRVIRRALGQGRKLGITQPFLAQVGQAVQDIYGQVYPQVLADQVLPLLVEEEQKFLKTLDRGLKEVQKYTTSITNGHPSLDEVAAKAFDFFQTYGLPADIFVDELTEHVYRYSIDDRLDIQDKYQQLFTKHQQLSRQGSAGMFKGGLGGDSSKEVQYHTATHLLQQALRDVLGDTVLQRGSNITPDRLRFDFTSETRLTPDQKHQVEDIVNAKIKADLPVTYTVLPLDQAQQTGAIHAFGEKYGDTVKVYSIGSYPAQDQPIQTGQGNGIDLAGQAQAAASRDQVYSREFCGGPHVAHTGLIQGTFIIQKDEKIAKDVVRIKAVLQ